MRKLEEKLEKRLEEENERRKLLTTGKLERKIDHVLKCSAESPQEKQTLVANIEQLSKVTADKNKVMNP